MSLTPALTHASAPTPSQNFDTLFKRLPAEIRFQILRELPHQALSPLAEATPSKKWEYHDDLLAACSHALVDGCELFWPRLDMQGRGKFLYFAQASTGNWYQNPNEVVQSPRVPRTHLQHIGLTIGRVPLQPPPLELSAWHLDTHNRHLQRVLPDSNEYWETRLQQTEVLCVQGRWAEAHILIEQLWTHLNRVPTAPLRLLKIAVETVNEELFDQALARAVEASKNLGSVHLRCDFEFCIKTLQFKSASKILSRLRAVEIPPSLDAYLQSAEFNRFVDELARLLYFRVGDAVLRIRVGDAKRLLNFLRAECMATSAQAFLTEHL